MDWLPGRWMDDAIIILLIAGIFVLNAGLCYRWRELERTKSNIYEEKKYSLENSMKQLV